MASICIKTAWVLAKFRLKAGPFFPMPGNTFRELRVVPTWHYKERQQERDAVNALRRNLSGGLHPLFGLPLCAPIGSSVECKWVIAFHDACVIVAPHGCDPNGVVAVTTLPGRPTFPGSFNAHVKHHAPSEWATYQKQKSRSKPSLRSGKWGRGGYTEVRIKRKPAQKAAENGKLCY